MIKSIKKIILTVKAIFKAIFSFDEIELDENHIEEMLLSHHIIINKEKRESFPRFDVVACSTENSDDAIATFGLSDYLLIKNKIPVRVELISEHIDSINSQKLFNIGKLIYMNYNFPVKGENYLSNGDRIIVSDIKKCKSKNDLSQEGFYCIWLTIHSSNPVKNNIKRPV